MLHHAVKEQQVSEVQNILACGHANVQEVLESFEPRVYSQARVF